MAAAFPRVVIAGMGAEMINCGDVDGKGETKCWLQATRGNWRWQRWSRVVIKSVCSTRLVVPVHIMYYIALSINVNCRRHHFTTICTGS